MAESSSSSSVSGAIRLSQDIATLINNRQGSDVQFKVGGKETTALPENSETIYDESTTMTIYAHSIILRCRSRYFATILDDEKQWKEGSKGVIYKPNISPTTFLDVLYYIYTGSVRARGPENFIELIAAAEEMGLEELSVKCQAELIRTIKLALSNEENDDSEEMSETERRLPIDVAVRTLIIPALKFANNHTLSHFLQELLSVTLPRITVITTSTGAYTIFVGGISSQILGQILASNDLGMKEKNVWNLALDWACHQTKLLKPAVEARLRMMNNTDDDDNNDESSGEIVTTDGADHSEEHVRQPFISVVQLKQLKAMITPFLPIIRFSLLESEDYAHMDDILSYFLPRRRFVELQRFFASPKDTRPLDMLRIKGIEAEAEGKIPSVIIVKSTTWKLLKQHIFEAGGISGCSSSQRLKFELLFRASEHSFRVNTFHQYCDNRGPTVVIVKSTNGYLFGGVNFAPWNSSSGYLHTPPSNLNFLFTLPDGNYRNDLRIFKLQSGGNSTYNNSSYGPTFGGGHDLYISDSANANNSSYSGLPNCYKGSGASNSTLAGAYNFTVSEYEVFAISKK